MKKIRLGVELVPQLVAPGTACDYLDKFISQLIYSPLVNHIKLLKVNDAKVLILTEQIKCASGEVVSLDHLVNFVDNKIKSSNGLFFGIESIQSLGSNCIELCYRFKNVAFLKKLFLDQCFFVGALEEFTGFFYPKVWTEQKKLLSPNLSHPYWGYNENFEIDIIMNLPECFNNNLSQDLVDVVFHGQFDQALEINSFFEVINWKTPLKYTLLSKSPILNCFDLVNAVGVDFEKLFVPKIGFYEGLSRKEVVRNDVFKNNIEVKLYSTEFFPNQIISKWIASLGLEKNLKVEEVVMDYRDFLTMDPGKFEIKLSILSLDFPDPVMFYLALSSYLQKNDRGKFFKCISDYLMSSDERKAIECKTLEGWIIDSDLILPFMDIYSKQLVKKEFRRDWINLILESGAGGVVLLDESCSNFNYGHYEYLNDCRSKVLKLIKDNCNGAFKKALDIGCGTGDFSLVIKKSYPSVDLISIDPVLGYVEKSKKKAREKGVEIDFRCESLFKFDESVELIFQFLSLCETLKNSSVNEIAIHIKNLIPIGGHWIIADEFEEDFITNDEKLGKKICELLGYKYISKYFMIAELRNYGFEIACEDVFITHRPAMNLMGVVDFIKSECSFNKLDETGEINPVSILSKMLDEIKKNKIVRVNNRITALVFKRIE